MSDFRAASAKRIAPARRSTGVVKSVLVLVEPKRVVGHPRLDLLGNRPGGEIHVCCGHVLATDQIQEISRAAHFSAGVKVINVKETKRSRVRLWPESPAGHFVAVSMSGAEVAEKKTKAAIARAIAGKLARRVATLFYDHRLDDFDNEK